MASTAFNCSIGQGFNFEKDSQSVVGHLTSLKIGDKEFAKDIEVMEPTGIKGDTKIKVVGIISGIYWNGGYADPLSVNCQLSAVNKQYAEVLQHSNLSDTTVEYDFVIYDYDSVAKVYFKAFHNNQKTLEGLVEKSGESSSTWTCPEPSSGPGWKPR